MKRSMLLAVTAAALLSGGFVLYRAVRPTPAQAAPPTDSPVPASYRHGREVHGSSIHYCLRGAN
jgi:hypothetical protein